MSFNRDTWRFPTEALCARRIFMCVMGSREDRTIRGIRIECEPLKLPEINSGYKKERSVTPHIRLSVDFGTSSLAELSERSFDFSQAEPTADNTVYLFDAHNPVDILRICFGGQSRSGLTTVFRLRFDFNFEDRIGGIFEHELSGIAKVEQR